MDLLIGQTLRFAGDPFAMPPEQAACWERRGAVAVNGGMVVDVGAADTLLARYPGARRHDYGRALISAGFVDAHAHYPQTRIIASWGKRLIDWLNAYTFPEEMRFHDTTYATEIAGEYLDILLAHGTTTVCSFCTVHPVSADALFAAAEARGMRIVAGKTCMDRNAPNGLRDTAQTAYDDSKSMISRWHGRGRAVCAVTPRFAPTSSPEQLAALGALWAEHPRCPMQTHLAEQPDEVAWVARLFPESRDYLDTYEANGLLGPGALYGHAIHLTAREQARIREAGGALVHCPTSNTFIGSGLFRTAEMIKQGQRVGLATDTGGGSSFSMLRTMAAAYEIGQLTGTALHPAQLWWLATTGSARALRLDDRIGNIAKGMEADITVLDLASTPAIAQRAGRAEDVWEALFPTIMMGDDRAVRAVWVAGSVA